jgi:hypothetical protein
MFRALIERRSLAIAGDDLAPKTGFGDTLGEGPNRFTLDAGCQPYAIPAT